MNARLNTLLKKWAMYDWGEDSSIFLDLAAIQWLGQKVFSDYEPSQFDRFEDRLDSWLHNISEEQEQQTLFLLLNHLFFIGRPEFESLCRAALHGPISRWLVEELDIDIADPQAMTFLQAGMENTWFCPITDSMRINSFLKVNKLVGKSHRPDWRSLRKFGNQQKITEYLTSNSIARIALLEDFVGSGTQMRSVVRFAADVSADVQIFVCPLVACPDGEAIGKELAAKYPNISYSSIMQIAPSALIKPDPQSGEPRIYGAIRDLILRVRTRLGTQEQDAESQRFHGYKGTGAVVAMYSNCPNNSLPILHDETSQWAPLFPRIRRD
jgi:hypothetical protein